MAGDWIKMGTGLRTHPKVVRLSSALKADRLRVIGGLHAVWSLFDAHSEDGSLSGYSAAAIDEELGWKGFARALSNVEWLEIDEETGEVRLPRYDTHNGASAKRRAMETERKRLARLEEEKAKAAAKADAERTASGQVSAFDADQSRTREEKRREEVSQKPSPNDDIPDPPAGATDPPVVSSSRNPEEVGKRSGEIAGLLRRNGANLTSGDPTVRQWAVDGIDDTSLLNALRQAQEQRHRKSDPKPINAGYLDAIVRENRPAAPVYDIAHLQRLAAT